MNNNRKLIVEFVPWLHSVDYQEHHDLIQWLMSNLTEKSQLALEASPCQIRDDKQAIEIDIKTKSPPAPQNHDLKYWNVDGWAATDVFCQAERSKTITYHLDDDATIERLRNMRLIEHFELKAELKKRFGEMCSDKQIDEVAAYLNPQRAERHFRLNEEREKYFAAKVNMLIAARQTEHLVVVLGADHILATLEILNKSGIKPKLISDIFSKNSPFIKTMERRFNERTLLENDKVGFAKSFYDSSIVGTIFPEGRIQAFIRLKSWLLNKA